MITCTVDIKKQQVKVTGHANYAPLGQDLVCAAVTAITFGTANYLVSEFKGSYEKEENMMLLEFDDIDSMHMMVAQLITVESGYSKYLEVVGIE